MFFVILGITDGRLRHVVDITVFLDTDIEPVNFE